jgi:hypothetical protein
MSRSGAHFPRLTSRNDRKHAIGLVQKVCEIAGSSSLTFSFENVEQSELRRAIASADTEAIFNWMIATLSFQGISDRVAAQYLHDHGGITWREIETQLARNSSCAKLRSYWHFHRCGYRKSEATCRVPQHFDDCAVPSHDLRNGRLNETAYSLFFFCRDVAGGDLVSWIARQLETAQDDLTSKFAALVDPLRNVFGVSDKMLTMTLSSLLIAAPDDYASWREVGFGMIVVDRLVHNFLVRTGITKRLGRPHAYGPQCYEANGCAEIIRETAAAIDARRSNAAYPVVFPRFVQHAIWRYCALDGLNVCNGNRIDDRSRCLNHTCDLYIKCERVALR